MKVLQVAAAAAIVIAGPSCRAADDHCAIWRGQVDPTIEVSVRNPPPRDDSERVAAFECLLGEQGNTGPARFSGATGTAVSAMLPDATVEVAALFYISFLYTGSWRHADGVCLVNRENQIVAHDGVAAAYSAYRKWLARVKEVGVARAHELGLDPLEGADLCWYGSKRCYEMNESAAGKN